MVFKHIWKLEKKFLVNCNQSKRRTICHVHFTLQYYRYCTVKNLQAQKLERKSKFICPFILAGSGSGTINSGSTNIWNLLVWNCIVLFEFFTFFIRFGPIISTKAILDKATNRCKGYGFVDFESPTSALAAVNELQSHGIQVAVCRLVSLYS